jgi:hypothetical protein
MSSIVALDDEHLVGEPTRAADTFAHHDPQTSFGGRRA